MFHYAVFVSGSATFGWASEFGWVGVDLFFVLSGYLIANQIFNGIARNKELKLSAFYARRFFRTLPVYWLILAAYYFFITTNASEFSFPLWRFLTFSQNWGLTTGTVFSEAWSLCVEEQFYLVLPLILIGGKLTHLRIRSGWFLLVTLLCAGVACRIWLWSAYQLDQPGSVGTYFQHIYYATICRFDEFLPGIAVAMLRNFHPKLWHRLQQRGHLSFVIGLCTSAAMLILLRRYYHVNGDGYGFFMTAFGYTLIAVSFSILLVSALSPASPLNWFKIPGIRELALLSYSFYLCHKPIAHVIKAYWVSHKLADVGLLPTVSILCIAVSALIYISLEQPFMQLRDRYFPSNFQEH